MKSAIRFSPLIFAYLLSACSTDDKLDLNAVVSKTPAGSLQPEPNPAPEPSIETRTQPAKNETIKAPPESLSKSVNISLYGKKASATLEAQIPEVVIEQAKKAGTKLDMSGIGPASGNVCIQGVIVSEAKLDLRKEKWSVRMAIDGKLKPAAIGVRPDGTADAKIPTDRIKMRACTKTKHLKIKSVVIEVTDRTRAKMFRQGWQAPWPK